MARGVRLHVTDKRLRCESLRARRSAWAVGFVGCTWAASMERFRILHGYEDRMAYKAYKVSKTDLLDADTDATII